MAQLPQRIEIQNWIAERLAERANVPASTIDASAPLAAFGLNSMEAVMLTGECERWLEMELPATLLFEYTTIDSLSVRLEELVNEANGGGSVAPPR